MNAKQEERLKKEIILRLIRLTGADKQLLRGDNDVQIGLVDEWTYGDFRVRINALIAKN